jgi:asparagine synthase (glutamine-hydrolysing)
VRCLLDGAGGELGPSFHGEGLYAEWLLTGRWVRLGRELRWRAAREGVAGWRLARSEVLKPLLPWWLLRLLGKAERFDIAQSQAQHPLQSAFVDRVLGCEGVRALRVEAARLGQPTPWHRTHKWQGMVWTQGAFGPCTEVIGTVALAYPFLDKRVLDFCLAAPGTWKIAQGYKRYLIRVGLAGLLPPSIQWRTTKEPFSPDFHLRYNRQREQVLALLAGIGPCDPVRQVVDVEKLIALAGHRMVGNRGDTPAEFAAMHIVPTGVYLLTFLRQFAEFQA